jgi:hypothetical protein
LGDLKKRKKIWGGGFFSFMEGGEKKGMCWGEVFFEGSLKIKINNK